MRIAIAILMALHGVAHLVGFVGSWQLTGPNGSIPDKTTLLAGKLALDGSGVRTMGIFWLLTAVAYWVASVAALMNLQWWMLAALGVTLFSLMLCIVALPETRIGVAVNLLILGALLVGERFEMFTTAP